MTVNIVDLNVPNLMDIPAALRRVADNIDKMPDEEKPVHAMLVFVNDAGDIFVHGYGQIGNRAHEVGTLQMAAVQMAISDYV